MPNNDWINRVNDPVLLDVLNRKKGYLPANFGEDFEPIPERGYLDAFLSGIKEQGAGVLQGQAEFLNTLGIGDGATANYLNEVMQNNARRRNYTWEDMIDDPWKYITDPEGLIHDLGGGVGSSAVLLGETAITGGVGGAAARAVGLAGKIGSTARMVAAISDVAGEKAPWLAKALKSPAGKLLVANVMKTPLEAASEGGNIARDIRESGGSHDEQLSGMLKGTALNMATLAFTNSLESAGLGKMIEGLGGKKAVSDLTSEVIQEASKKASDPGFVQKHFMPSLKAGYEAGKTLAGMGLQNAYEEGAQESISQYAKGEKDSLADIYNPARWNEEAKTAAAIGGVTGIGQGGIMTGIGKGVNYMFGEKEDKQQELKTPNEEAIKDLSDDEIFEAATSMGASDELLGAIAEDLKNGDREAAARKFAELNRVEPTASPLRPVEGQRQDAPKPLYNKPATEDSEEEGERKPLGNKRIVAPDEGITPKSVKKAERMDKDGYPPAPEEAPKPPAWTTAQPKDLKNAGNVAPYAKGKQRIGTDRPVQKQDKSLDYSGIVREVQNASDAELLNLLEKYSNNTIYKEIIQGELKNRREARQKENETAQIVKRFYNMGDNELLGFIREADPQDGLLKYAKAEANNRGISLTDTGNANEYTNPTTANKNSATHLPAVSDFWERRWKLFDIAQSENDVKLLSDNKLIDFIHATEPETAPESLKAREQALESLGKIARAEAKRRGIEVGKANTMGSYKGGVLMPYSGDGSIPRSSQKVSIQQSSKNFLNALAGGKDAQQEFMSLSKDEKKALIDNILSENSVDRTLTHYFSRILKKARQGDKASQAILTQMGLSDKRSRNKKVLNISKYQPLNIQPDYGKPAEKVRPIDQPAGTRPKGELAPAQPSFPVEPSKSGTDTITPPTPVEAVEPKVEPSPAVPKAEPKVEPKAEPKPVAPKEKKETPLPKGADLAPVKKFGNYVLDPNEKQTATVWHYIHKDDVGKENPRFVRIKKYAISKKYTVTMNHHTTVTNDIKSALDYVERMEQLDAKLAEEKPKEEAAKSPQLTDEMVGKLGKPVKTNLADDRTNAVGRAMAEMTAQQVGKKPGINTNDTATELFTKLNAGKPIKTDYTDARATAASKTVEGLSKGEPKLLKSAPQEEKKVNEGNDKGEENKTAEREDNGLGKNEISLDEYRLEYRHTDGVLSKYNNSGKITSPFKDKISVVDYSKGSAVVTPYFVDFYHNPKTETDYLKNVPPFFAKEKAVKATEKAFTTANDIKNSGIELTFLNVMEGKSEEPHGTGPIVFFKTTDGNVVAVAREFFKFLHNKYDKKEKYFQYQGNGSTPISVTDEQGNVVGLIAPKRISLNSKDDVLKYIKNGMPKVVDLMAKKGLEAVKKHNAEKEQMAKELGQKMVSEFRNKLSTVILDKETLEGIVNPYAKLVKDYVTDLNASLKHPKDEIIYNHGKELRARIDKYQHDAYIKYGIEKEEDISAALKRVGEEWATDQNYDPVEKIVAVVKTKNGWAYSTSKHTLLYEINDIKTGESKKLEEHKANLQKSIDRAERRANVQKEIEDKIKKEKEDFLKSLYGFADDMSEARKAQIVRVLHEKSKHFPTKTRKQFIEEAVLRNFGSYIDKQTGTAKYFIAWDKENGEIFREYQVTKTEYDYYNHFYKDDNRKKLEAAFHQFNGFTDGLTEEKLVHAVNDLNAPIFIKEKVYKTAEVVEKAADSGKFQSYINTDSPNKFVYGITSNGLNDRGLPIKGGRQLTKTAYDYFNYLVEKKQKEKAEKSTEKKAEPAKPKEETKPTEKSFEERVAELDKVFNDAEYWDGHSEETDRWSKQPGLFDVANEFNNAGKNKAKGIVGYTFRGNAMFDLDMFVDVTIDVKTGKTNVKFQNNDTSIDFNTPTEAEEFLHLELDDMNKWLKNHKNAQVNYIPTDLKAGIFNFEYSERENAKEEGTDYYFTFPANGGFEDGVIAEINSVYGLNNVSLTLAKRSTENKSLSYKLGKTFSSVDAAKKFLKGLTEDDIYTFLDKGKIDEKQFKPTLYADGAKLPSGFKEEMGEYHATYVGKDGFSYERELSEHPGYKEIKNIEKVKKPRAGYSIIVRNEWLPKDSDGIPFYSGRFVENLKEVKANLLTNSNADGTPYDLPDVIGSYRLADDDGIYATYRKLDENSYAYIDYTAGFTGGRKYKVTLKDNNKSRHPLFTDNLDIAKAYIATGKKPRPNSPRNSIELESLIDTELVNKGFANLVGKKVHSLQELGEIAQALKNPGYEKSHRIYVNKNDEIIRQETVTMYYPTEVRVNVPSEEENYKKLANDDEIAKIYYLHNHPTGDPTPSHADLKAAKALYESEAKEKFGGSIVIDTDKFAVIDKGQKITYYELDESKKVTFNKENGTGKLVGSYIEKFNDIANLCKEINSEDNIVAFGIIDHDNVKKEGKIGSVIRIPKEIKEMPLKSLQRYFRYLARKTYSNYLILYVKDAELYNKIRKNKPLGYFMVIKVNDQGEMEDYAPGYQTPPSFFGYSPSEKNLREVVYTSPDDEVQYSAVQQAKIQQTLANIEKEIKAVFKGSDITNEGNGSFLVAMPNGMKIRVNVKDQIILNANEQARAKAAHNLKGTGMLIEGFWQKLTKQDVDGVINLSLKGGQGSTFHETLHAAVALALTKQETKVLRDYCKAEAKRTGKKVDEVLAEAFREWMMKRQKRQGTLLGKLWQKVLDWLKDMRNFFGKMEDAEDIMRKIATGKVWERTDVDTVRSGKRPLYQSAGEKAKNANIQTLEQAKRMTSDGANRKEVYEATGWYKGQDNKWRFEIPDNLDDINLSPLITEKETTLGDIYNNKELYNAYPWLKNIKIHKQDLEKEHGGFTDTSGITVNSNIIKGTKNSIIKLGNKSYNVSEDQKRTIKITDENGNVVSDGDLYWNLVTMNAKGREAVLERIDNNIKNIEKNKDNDYGDVLSLIFQKQYSPKRLEELKKQRKLFSESTKKDFSEIKSANLEDLKSVFIHEIQHLIQEYEGFARGGAPENARKQITNRIKTLQNSISGQNASQKVKTTQEIQKLTKALQKSDFQLYQDLHGEQEARLAQKKAKLAKKISDTRKIEVRKPSDILKDHISAIPAWYQRDAKKYVELFELADYGFDELEKDQFHELEKRLEKNEEGQALIKDLYGNNMAEIVKDQWETGQLDEDMEDLVLNGIDDDNEVTFYEEGAAPQYSAVEDDFTGPYADTQRLANVTKNSQPKSFWKQVKEDGYFKALRKKFYADWVDQEYPLQALIDRFAEAMGRPVTREENVRERATAITYNAAGISNALLNGTGDDITAVNNHLMKNVKLPYKVTLQTVMDKIKKPLMDKMYPNYLKDAGFNTWHEAFSNYLLAKRLREMYDIRKEQYAQAIKEAKAEGKKPPKWEDWEYKLPNGIKREMLDRIIAMSPKPFEEASKLYYMLNDNLMALLEDGGLIDKTHHDNMNNKYKAYCPLMRDFSDTAAADAFLEGIGKGGTGIGNVNSPVYKIKEGGSERNLISPLESTYNAISIYAERCERNKVGQMAVGMSEKAGTVDLIVEMPEGTSPSSKESTFSVMFNGKKRIFQCEPSLYGPIAGYNVPAASMTFRVATMAANALRTGATMSPSFIVRNIFRDTFSAGVNSDNGFIPIVDTIKGIIALKKNPEITARFKAAGVDQFNFYGNGEARYKKLEEMTEESHWYQNPIKAIYNTFREWAELGEAGTRMGEFMRALEKGKDDLRAAEDARDVTLNFTRMGAYGGQVNKVVPFFNACIQGGDKLIRTFHKDFVGTCVRTFKYIVLPSLFLWAWNHDEDWYKELSPEMKNSYWFLGKTAKIPKPQEIGILFGGGVEMLLDEATNADPQAMKNWKDTLIGVMLPGAIPTAILPVIEWQANYNFFRQKEVVSRKLQGLPDKEQYNGGTSEISKALGRLADLSPVKIDNTISGLTGTMGMFTWQMIGEPFSDKEEPERKWFERPFIRDFAVTDMNLGRSVNEFYEINSNAEKEYAAYGKKGRPSIAVKAIRAAYKSVSALNKDIRNITDRNIPPAKKRELIDKKKALIKKIASKIVAKYGEHYL